MPGTQKIGNVAMVAGGSLKPFKADRLLYDEAGLPTGSFYVGHFQSASEGFTAINLQVGRTLQWTPDVREDGLETYTGVMP
jgi:hypothetical protein